MKPIDMIYVRPYHPASDDGFIYSTMIRGLYYGDSWFSKIPKKLFVENYRKVIALALSTPGTIVRIACIKDDPDEIKGYSILLNNDTSLMWVFVKKDWRNIGIARVLVPEGFSQVTNLTALGEILLKKYPKVIFNPFA